MYDIPSVMPSAAVEAVEAGVEDEWAVQAGSAEAGLAEAEEEWEAEAMAADAAASDAVLSPDRQQRP